MITFFYKNLMVSIRTNCCFTHSSLTSCCSNFYTLWINITFKNRNFAIWTPYFWTYKPSIKKIWIRLIKRPILPRIINYFNTVVKPFMLSYINTENGKIEFNTNKLISDLSKYSYKLLYILLGLVISTIVYYLYF